MGNWNLLRKRTPSRIYRLRELSKTVVLMKNGKRFWRKIPLKLKGIFELITEEVVHHLLRKNFEMFIN
jgi:hypothetical protein